MSVHLRVEIGAVAYYGNFQVHAFFEEVEPIR